MPSELGMAVGERRPLNKGWKDIMHVIGTAASCSLDVDRRREGQRKKTRTHWGQVIIIRLSVKHH